MPSLSDILKLGLELTIGFPDRAFRGAVFIDETNFLVSADNYTTEFFHF
jgi:hypothetical protein